MADRLNLITDVAGLTVGHAHDPRLVSGVSVALFDRPAVLAVAVGGGAPGHRNGASHKPGMLVETVDAVVLSGGSAFGLDAASGVEAYLRAEGRGLAVGAMRVPIVAEAICFDLLNGGDKAWGRFPPYRELAFEACGTASRTFPLGSHGGGYGATTVDLKGGVGSASVRTSGGHTIGALVVVNAISSAVVGGGPHFWAAPFEVAGEFGGLGPKSSFSPSDLAVAVKGRPIPAAGSLPPTGTTIALVATDAHLTHAQVQRLAHAADDGLPRALRLAHGLTDGDTVFAASLGDRPLSDPVADQIELGALAADCLARAIARGVYKASTPPPPYAGPSAYRDRFPAAAGGRR